MTERDWSDRKVHPAPLFNSQKLKLGVFGMNCSGGLLMSQPPTSFRMNWEQNRAIVQKADGLGFEIALPLGRWRGFGGATDHNGTSFETYTWAAGLAEITKSIMLFATSHVSFVHPVVAAKQAVTINHMSNGRFGLNLLMGWFSPEMAMFGGTALEHEDRYRYGEEWLTIVNRLWNEDEPFDFDGKYFALKGAQGKPKPQQRGRPVLVNAGNSPVAIDFAARNVDFCFAALDTPESIGKHLKVRDLARTTYGREVGLFAPMLVICRETEAEARAVHQAIIDNGDQEAARNFLSVLGLGSQSFSDRLRDPAIEKFFVGNGSHPVVGTPEQVVDQLQQFSEFGLSGALLYFVDYLPELEYFGERVMPLMKQAGLRH